MSDKLKETMEKLKPFEGKRVYFKYRGKVRPFILQAVQDTEPDINNPIRGEYLSEYGEARLDYDYPANNREWAGFWTKRIHDISTEEK